MAASGVFLLSINLAKSPCSAKLYWFIITGQLVIDRLCLSSKEAVSFVFYPLVKKRMLLYIKVLYCLLSGTCIQEI